MCGASLRLFGGVRAHRALLDLLDAAYGLSPELFEWVVAPDSFQARLKLFDRIDDAELLLEGSRRLLLQLTGWPVARQLAVERIVLKLEHERGKVASAPALAAQQLQPMAPPSESLFPEPGGTEEDRMRMLELLVARLGAENVLQPMLKADYRPEQANLWVPVQQKITDKARNAQMPPDVTSLPRPTWLLAKPIALLMRDHRPFYGSPLRMASNPERIEAGWWNGLQTRDYFIAEGQDHTLYWVYRERLGTGEEEPRWFLHGLFG